MLIAERLARTAERFGSRPAAIQGGEQVSWQQLDELADRGAAGLVELGIGSSDRVAIQLPNSLAYLAAWYAILRVGATAVPLNPRYQPDELGYLLADSEVAATVAYAPLAPALAALAPRLPRLRHVLISDLSPLNLETGPPAAGPTLPFEPWVVQRRAAVSRPWLQAPPVADDAPATCLYTSGTSGRPKGALLTHRGLLWNIDQLLQVFAADADDRFLCALPLFHSYAQMACIMSTLTLGAAMIILPQFRPETVLDVIVRDRVTIFPGVPAHYGAMLSAVRGEAPQALGALRLAVTGGAAMPLPVLEALERRYRVVVLEGNGPTEAGPVAYVNPERGPRKPGSVGPPIPGIRVRVVDATDSDVPLGEVGEVLVSGPSVMLGYLNRPEETREALRGGWLHTGDLGRLDEDGYLFLVDRKTDLIIVGGLNVYPREVEEALLRHPAVAEAAVVGVPEAARGERVVAFVVARAGQAPTGRELIRHCQQLLAPYKCPRRILLVPALDKNAAGKVQKLQLRVLAQQQIVEEASQP